MTADSSKIEYQAYIGRLFILAFNTARIHRKKNGKKGRMLDLGYYSYHRALEDFIERKKTYKIEGKIC